LNKFYIVLPLILIGSLAIGQTFQIYNGDTINLTDTSSFKQGLWLKFTKDEKVKEESYFLDNQLNGTRKKYFSSGLPKTQEKYLRGIKEGVFEYYYPNGAIKEKGTWRNGQLFGWHKKYYSENDKISEEGNVENDIKVGEWKYYNKNARLTAIGKFNNGEKDGKWLEYDDQGNEVKHTKFINGIVIVIIETK